MLRFDIDGKVFANALEKISPFLTRGFTSLNLYLGIKTDTDSGPSLFTGTLSAFAWKAIEADVSQPGTILVNGSILKDIVKSAQDETITVEEKETGIDIIAGRSNWSMFKIEGDDWTPYRPEGDPTFIFDFPNFKEMIKSTRDAAAEASAQRLDYIELRRIKYDDSECLRTVATDGKRMFIAEREMLIKINDDAVDSNILDDKGILLSDGIIKAVAEMPETETLEIFFNKTKTVAIMRAGDMICGAPISQDKYANYEMILTGLKEPSTKTKILCSDMKSALRKIGIISSDGNMRLKVDKHEIELTGKDDKDSATIIIETEDSGGENICGLNGKYIKSAIDSCGADSIMIEIDNAESPVIIKPLDSEHYWRGIVMPVRM